MIELVLHRVGYSSHATYGVLLKDNVPMCLTLEDPWIDNKRNVSCIPHGVYEAQRYSSKKFGNTFVVMDVPDRSGIIIHAGNWAGYRNVSTGANAGDTQGCILLGLSCGVPNQSRGAVGVLSSAVAMARFKRKMRGINEFQLVVE